MSGPQDPARRAVARGLARAAACAAFGFWAAPGLAAGADAPGSVFRDCPDCPEMVVVPAGSFTMGAPDDEPERQRWDGPQVEVTITKPFALGRYEVTLGEFAAFAAATRRRIPESCRVFDGKWASKAGASWAQPGHPQGERHPVVCVDWYDALAYVEWLNTKGGHRYYLPSEAQFEYANRAGARGPFPWAGERADICRHANVADRQVKSRWPDVAAHDCDDGYTFTAPVGSFAANRFGLHDTFGNAWEWVFDCWSFDHAARPPDGTPLTTGEHCQKRVIKGAGYESIAKYARAASRGRDDIPGTRIAVIGFRVAAELGSATAGTGDPSAGRPGRDAPPAVRRTTLLVSDITRSMAFYAALGLEKWYDKASTSEGPTGVIGAQDLPLGAQPGTGRIVIMKGNDPRVGMIGLLGYDRPKLPDHRRRSATLGRGDAIVMIEVADMDAVMQRLAGAGFRPLRAPYAFTVPAADGRTLAGRRAFVRDPDGHLVEVSEPAR
jgi:formylglycine-generating enzyme required for sulfatase activity/catechol 2,3-dioxygenase-like lactoylglutathione lyase family enzyme